MSFDAGGPEPWDRCVISGASGSGKTSLVRGLFRRRRVTARLIGDMEDEYEGSAETVCRTREDLHAVLSEIDEGGYESYSVRYAPDLPVTDDADLIAQHEANEAGYLAQWALRLGECVCLLDEAHNCCGQHTCSGHTLTLAKRGRKRDAFLWAASQGPFDVKTSVRKELRAAEAWYLLLVEENDLEILRRSRGSEFADRVAHLPILHALRVLPHAREPEEWVIEWGRGPVPNLRRIK